jgi:alkanesulfonate monooxygenase SsuD/methylene tetrahydromethanopterin reductase-like flavin-dependent oxidoreductase (luciferase family)
VEFGLVASQFTGKWRYTQGDAELAEDVGLDSVWLVDHLVAPRRVEDDMFEGWTALAVLAGATSRIRLGHLVLAASFRNPGLLAKMAATLDHASGGRLDLGLGAGWYRDEYEAFGYRFPDAGERRRYLSEYIEVIRLLFAGGAVDYDGELIRVSGAYCHPTPLQTPSPPIVVGAAGPLMLDLVGRQADVWNCPARLIPQLDEARDRVHAAADGRGVRTTLQIPVAVGRTPEEAAAAREVGSVHMAWMGDIDEVGVTGTIDEAEEKVSLLTRRGVDGLIAVLPGTRRRPDFIAAYGELAARF